MPHRPALSVDGAEISYEELLSSARSIAATVQRRDAAAEPPLTAVFADRSRTAFTGILGALLAGRGYVPLSPALPIARTQSMLQRAGCRSIVVDGRGGAQLDALLEGFEGRLLVILPDATDVTRWVRRWPWHTFVGAAHMRPATELVDAAVSSDAVAYLLFTSGSTGVPKGVGVTHGNVAHFVRAMVDRYGFSCEDRFSQMFDTTFDLSVFDMFVAWHHGACVYCPPRTTLLNPDRFIREHGLTVWFSVPSVGLLMQRFGALNPGRYPSLRWSLFCGEPLPVSLAGAWAAAAPASRVENLYGPTELTVACTAYRWDPTRSPAEASAGIVPIGTPLPGMQARVVDELLTDVAAGEVGELLMTGPQRTPGYWADAAATTRAHVRLRDDDRVYYRTGDRVRRLSGDGPLTYVGRTDHQIKVFGHRVELGEVEAALRREPGVHAAVAVGWPMTRSGPSGIAAFVTGDAVDPAALLSSVRRTLQAAAVPQTIHVLSDFPRTPSGKFDRQALVRLLGA